MANQRICSIEGCGKKVYGKGFCQKHHYRLWKHGDPLGGRVSPGEPMRFIDEVALLHDGMECLFWPYAKRTGGAATVQINGKLESVARYICSVVNGEPPTPTHEAAHSCGKGHLACIAPIHLSWKTPKENQADRLVHGTDRRGEKSPTSKLTEADVIQIRGLQGTLSQSKIADQFGISREHVGHVQSRKKWAWLT